MQVAIQAVNAARPGVSRARVSLARSLRPITSASSRASGSAAVEAIEPADSIAIGVSIIAQSRVFSGAPASRKARAACMIVPGPSTFGSRMPSGAAEIAACRSSSPQGVCGPLIADDDFAAAETACLHRLHDLRARGRFRLRSDRVFEIEDQGVGRQAYAPWPAPWRWNPAYTARCDADERPFKPPEPHSYNLCDAISLVQKRACGDST